MRVVGAEAQQRSTRRIPCKARVIVMMTECIPLANLGGQVLFRDKRISVCHV